LKGKGEERTCPSDWYRRKKKRKEKTLRADEKEKPYLSMGKRKRVIPIDEGKALPWGKKGKRTQENRKGFFHTPLGEGGQ